MSSLRKLSEISRFHGLESWLLSDIISYFHRVTCCGLIKNLYSFFNINKKLYMIRSTVSFADDINDLGKFSRCSVLYST